MSTSSRTSAPSPPPIKVRRKRASTKALLGSEYLEVITKVLDPPKPGKTLDDYDEIKLKKGLLYADSTLRAVGGRKLSPLGMRAVLLYKEAVSNLLDLEEGEELEHYEEEVKAMKERWVSIVRMHEESAQYYSYLTITSSDNAQELQNEITKLLRIAFFARYGDAIADACQRLRGNAEKRKIPGWQSLTGYWTEINKRLLIEKADWEKVLLGEGLHSRCPTHMAISGACYSVGFDLDEMLAIVSLYATRNQIVHADIGILIKNGQFDDLKKRLYNDYCDIPRVIPASEGIEATLMSKLLKEMMGHWFTPDETDPDNIQLWAHTVELKNYYHELLKGGTDGEVHKKVMKEITTNVAKRLKDDEKAKDLVEKMEINFGLASGKQKIKRVASVELEKEVKRARLMEKGWKTLMNMAAGMRKISETYIAEFGELDQPPLVIHDPTLD